MTIRERLLCTIALMLFILLSAVVWGKNAPKPAPATPPEVIMPAQSFTNPFEMSRKAFEEQVRRAIYERDQQDPRRATGCV